MSRKTPQQVCDEWNSAHPVGTVVTYWPIGLGLGCSREGATRHEATVVGETPSAWIEGYRTCIALTRVEVTPSTEVIADVDYFDPSPKADETGEKA